MDTHLRGTIGGRQLPLGLHETTGSFPAADGGTR